MTQQRADAVTIPRVSSKRQEDEGYSLPAQRKLLKSYALDRQLNPIKTFEIAESASKAEQRKIFRDAMKFIEDNDIKHLIVEKVDRHVRNLHDAVDTYDWLMADEQRRLHFVKDSLVMHKNSRSQEWLNWGIRVVMAKNYIDNLREEAMKGWAEKLAQGWLPGVPPPGYMTISHEGKRIHVPNPETKQLVRLAFQKYLDPNQSVASIAAEMDKMGIRTRKGRPYVKSKVQKMLSNPFYIGINRHDGKDYPGVQEQIISKELFERVQQKLHGGRPLTFIHHNPALKSLIHCADCHTAVTWQWQKGRYYGVCRRKSAACKSFKLLREEQVEDLIVGMLQQLICPSQEIIEWVSNAMQEHYKDNIETGERLSASIQVQIARLDRMDINLYDDKLSGEISQERYEAKHEQFIAEIAELTKRLNMQDAMLAQRLEQKLVLLELSQKAAELYRKKSPEGKRLIISKLFKDLTIKGGILSVTYTNFARAIAENVLETRKLMEVTK
jgi:site-specific DNA recombinase